MVGAEFKARFRACLRQSDRGMPVRSASFVDIGAGMSILWLSEVDILICRLGRLKPFVEVGGVKLVL